MKERPQGIAAKLGTFLDDNDKVITLMSPDGKSELTIRWCAGI